MSSKYRTGKKIVGGVGVGQQSQRVLGRGVVVELERGKAQRCRGTKIRLQELGDRVAYVAEYQPAIGRQFCLEPGAVHREIAEPKLFRMVAKVPRRGHAFAAVEAGDLNRDAGFRG